MVNRTSFIQRRIIWQALILASALLITWPFLALVQLSIGSSSDLWVHLFETVLFVYISNTLVLMISVASLSGIIGVSSAWVLYKYNMPGKKILEIMILLPAACLVVQ